LPLSIWSEPSSESSAQTSRWHLTILGRRGLSR
jgi:hypothetical protein